MKGKLSLNDSISSSDYPIDAVKLTPVYSNFLAKDTATIKRMKKRITPTTIVQFPVEKAPYYSPTKARNKKKAYGPDRC